MSGSHSIERDSYDCDCGASWYGDEAAIGCTIGETQECPQCGEDVEPRQEEIG